MLWKLAFEGPLTAAVDATTWQDYLGGVIQFHCETKRNHAVQIVGYDISGQIRVLVSPFSPLLTLQFLPNKR